MSRREDPEHIAISKSKGIKIDWKDGQHSDFSLPFLRDHCPCATCTGAHGEPPQRPEASAPFQLYKPALKITAVEPVGNYAIRIQWNDGHNSGIYSFQYLRTLSQET
ncbi:MAG: DUF971 domain-containing protein [Bryobacteraceae bacterium]|nr:DUF971 domain-containing protein [Bryobacteraceae bacterium]